ncbi:MAG: hypothetical protein RIR31_2058, partial [Bacteroidota bacterium]
MKKRLRPIGLLLIAIAITTLGMAQQKNITGKVVDAAGKPLMGVTVSVKNKNTATTSAENGNFVITASAGDILSFSFVGYINYEEKAGAASTLNVTLTASVGNLNEVVVIGYGTTRKRDLTGAVATVTAKDFNKGAIT